MTKSAAKKKETTALSLLAKDFGTAMTNFREFAKVVEKDDSNIDRKVELVRETCADVMTHLQVREDVFYPAVKSATGDEQLVKRELAGNQTVKALISRLNQLAPDDELFDATFIVLGETVTAHVKQEQQILFPEARAAGLDAPELAQKIRKRAAELTKAGFQP